MRSVYCPRISPNNDWDYKKNSTLIDAGVPPDVRDAFGNWYYGFVMAAKGVPLSIIIGGAGGFQAFFQKEGSLSGFVLGALYSRLWTASASWMEFGARNLGMSFGDNPGDTLNIISGAEYFYGGQ